jgi:uncharacterized protein
MNLTLNPTQFYTLYRPERCEKRLYLDYKRVEASPPGAYTQGLFRLGQRHEKSHLVTFPSYEDLTGAGCEKTIEKLKEGTPVIYHGELRLQTIIDGQAVRVVGIPDFIIKDENGYFIQDCKLSRHATESEHPEILCQLHVYGWLFEKITGDKPLRLEAFLGDGSIAEFDYQGDDLPISHLRSLMKILSFQEEPYSPVGWSKCISCGYHDRCWEKAYHNQDVALVYGVDQNLARRLKEIGVAKIEEFVKKFDQDSLSEFKRPWGKREQKVGKKAEGILLQAKAMQEGKEIILKKPELPRCANYVMFDLEGLPPQLDELDKIYLWGMQVFGERPGHYQRALAEIGPEGDAKGWNEFLRIAGRIFDEYGDIPFIHWHHYEKSKINAYIKCYGDRDGIAERVLTHLVDLLKVTRDAIILPEPSYSLKVVEKFVGFRRSQDEYGGDWSIAKYIEAVETEDEKKRRSIIEEILKYNEEDLQATWAVLEWIKDK